ncbi:conserved Plasmodium protein, unknown function [Plasmodium knowlesi strain H]|uniref:Uncharacterized protein n=1 Tax=Plasmodium knowlesi (strain H) TaxID=5851 RepID=A0A679L7B6_PLAKH|nr:conserved Plasmodium protein, unknown function [Plasmodium knowlesi strain H]CAA9990911.1 conserved Plasmodium protein, unknown function [Plasmodium knowlesi strain H]VVS80385.1 conserved Plasmodium protein, unknown function [Plasmodium knowlesi strain H]
MGALCHTFFTMLRDLRNLYKPYTAFSFLFFPCAINVYGIYKFNNLESLSNKEVAQANVK